MRNDINVKTEDYDKVGSLTYDITIRRARSPYRSKIIGSGPQSCDFSQLRLRVGKVLYRSSLIVFCRRTEILPDVPDARKSNICRLAY